MGIENQDSECRGAACGFGLWEEELSCNVEGNDCFLANFVEAEESAFHDRQMAEATKAIKAILAKIPEDSKGRKVSMINAKSGFLLAWVDHSGKINEKAITQDSDEKTLAAALRLKL